MSNLEQQRDEIEALKSIYYESFAMENEETSSFSVVLTKDIKIYVTLTPLYPTEEAPKLTLVAPYFNQKKKSQLYKEFEDIFNNAHGEPIVYQCVEKVREMADIRTPEHSEESSEEEVIQNFTEKVTTTYDIIHGPVIVDRKSVFQGHTCRIQSQDDVKKVMAQVLENKKVKSATHNIMAYRLKLPSGGLAQDYDDDGETQAGGRLLHLLQMTKVMNVIVVVTRWYGGIHLGPDRFKHINNAGRKALQVANFIEEK